MSLVLIGSSNSSIANLDQKTKREFTTNTGFHQDRFYIKKIVGPERKHIFDENTVEAKHFNQHIK